MNHWGIKWRQRNRLDGRQDRLIWRAGLPLAFRTRREARDWIAANYGYIAGRRDLREEPHGWRMPLAVRVNIKVTECRR